MYNKDILRKYISDSWLRIYNERIKVRLSKELALKYDAGIYDKFLEEIDKGLQMLDGLNIKYPSNSMPILYIYVVLDDNFVELLNFPKTFAKGKNGGGKAVACYDLDGFNFAYGLSQNVLENAIRGQNSIDKLENNIHELSHLVLGQFFMGNQTISEGVAEMFPLYGLGLEEMFEEHREVIVNLSKNQILSAKELLNSEKDGTFGNSAVLQNKSCSFRYSYISAYLLVRGLIENIEECYKLSKSDAIQYFLEVLRTCNYRNEWLIYDIANALNLNQEELLVGKDIQLGVVNKLKKVRNNKE